MRKLTKKQKAFISEYLIDFNATAAAKRAGYSKNTAHDIGSENLRKPNIKKAVDLEIKKRNKSRELKEDDIINELRKIAFSDVSNYYNAKFDLKDLSTLQIEFTGAIKEIVRIPTDKGTRVAVKLYSKEHALELLGKHLGMWKADQSDKDYHIVVIDETEKIEKGRKGEMEMGEKAKGKSER